ncbi:MAG: EAL domain-containing protein [Saccharospirillaceae bacterium]|nr:EAL domain-containing protein [Pseudomonadales bacterium]NRB77524.1 EAL domain-containing protein [Saccharospirillaceae bacterium]
MPTISPEVLIDLIENKRFSVEYQPIINLDTNKVYGYEALSRFVDAQGEFLRADHVYASLHYSPLSLFQVEYEQKKLQLSGAPTGGKIFINVDQDSYFASGISGINNPFLKLFNEYNSADIIVELIENSEINDAKMSLEMIETLSENNIQTAIDDVFGPLSMLSFEVIQLVNYVKLDKYVVQNKHNKELMILVKAIVDYARVSGKKTILEGIETQDDLLIARELNVDFIQGFLFKDQFIYK